MNIWNFSGEVLKHGIKGTQFPKLWTQVRINNPTGFVLPDNTFFITFDFDNNTGTKRGKICSYIKDRLGKDRFFFLSEALVSPIKLNKKVGEEWVTEEVTGIRGKVDFFKLDSMPFSDINLGLVQGTVSQFQYNDKDNSSKIVVEDRYRNPKDNTWKARKIPLLIPSWDKDISNRSVFIQASLCGKTPQNIDKIYGLVRKIIV